MEQNKDQSGAVASGKPQFPWNPDPINHEWTQPEIAAIHAFGEGCYQAGIASVQSGAAVRGEAVAAAKNELSYKGADGKYLDAQGWEIEHEDFGSTVMVPIHRNGVVIALVVAEWTDDFRGIISENCRILCDSPRAADALDSQPTVSDGWISVKDRLPELGQTVLAVNNEYGQRESKFDRWSQGSINRANYGEEAGYFNWQEPMNNWGSSWKPTHWMPLQPAPASSQPTDGGVRNG